MTFEDEPESVMTLLATIAAMDHKPIREVDAPVGPITHKLPHNVRQ
ncbi:hypothetical protein [Arthrobacter sp. UYCu723]